MPSPRPHVRRGRPARRQGATRQGASRDRANRQGATRQGATRRGATRQGASRDGANRQGLTRRSRHRLFGVLAVFAVAFALITYKLVAIQGTGNRSLQQVTDAHVTRTVLADLRGSILASDGDELALSELRPTIFADPHEITQAAAPDHRSVAAQRAWEAARLAPVVHRSAASLVTAFDEKTTYVALATDQSGPTGTAVSNLTLPGIGSEEEPVRFHPDGSLDAALLGGVNSTGGDAGLEYEYNHVLSGTPGRLVESVDQNLQPIPGSITEDRPAVDGDDIRTTIDETLEYQTEEALEVAVASAHAKGGTALIMDTSTGDLLAVASIVSSPEGPVQAPTAEAFTNVYEPGSVAKLITISAALAEHRLTATTKLTVPDGYSVGGTLFHDAEFHPTEQLTPTGILAQSSNIGAIEVAQKLGARTLYGYEEAYGLTNRTAVDFPGESSGLVTPLSQFSGTTLPTMAFGEANAVTAAQMIAAFNTVADGGLYVSPRLVTATVGSDGRQHAVHAPAPRRVIPASVAGQVTSMLEQVVSTGTGTAAKIPTYAVAGKTGTANVLNPDGTGYIGGRYVSSFAGFAPAEHPAVTAMVVIDNTPLFGAAASAPMFSQIVTDALIDLGIPTDGTQPKASTTAIPWIHGKPETSILGE